MKGLIYKATSPSGRSYIGQTKGSLRRRMKRHISDAYRSSYHLYDSKFSRAIRKYGDNIKWEILTELVESQVLLDKLEQHYITEFDTINSGYNCNEGGGGNKGYKHTEESRKKMRNSHADFSGKNNPMFGRAGFKNKKHSPETKAKMREARLRYLERERNGMRIG